MVFGCPLCEPIKNRGRFFLKSKNSFPPNGYEVVPTRLSDRTFNPSPQRVVGYADKPTPGDFVIFGERRRLPPYARGLHDTKDLPGGDFETQFTFAQTLTEEVKSVPGAMLVVSLPASADGGGGVPSPLRKRLTMVWGGILGCVGGKFWVLARMRWVYWSRVRRRMPNWKPNVRNLCQKQPGRERSLPAVFRQMAAQRQCPKLRELGGHLYPHPRHISSEA